MEQEPTNKKQKMDDESATERRKELINLVFEYETRKDNINRQIKVLESERDHLWAQKSMQMDNQGPLYGIDYTINGSRSRSQELVGFFMSENEAKEVIEAVNKIKMKKKIVLKVEKRKPIAFTNGFEHLSGSFEEYKHKMIKVITDLE